MSFEKVDESLIYQRFEDFASDWEKADRSIAGCLRRVASFLGNRNDRSFFPARRELTDGYTFAEEFGQDGRKFWRKVFEDNDWNTVGSTGLGTVKTRNDF